MIQIEIRDLSFENVWNLTEEEVFLLVGKIMTEFENREERNHYIKIIDSAFEFRTVSSSQRNLIGGLSSLGFQFFKVEDTKILRGICKRKKSSRSIF
ncbi:MAG: hypothetical protein LBR10_10270 [Prevotellaceae bacterium]|jgi:hypothetical protein|nr:hypothetical protein [Prevotellaceae bacterium]